LITFEKLQDCEVVYDNKEAIRLILKIRLNKDDERKRRFRMRLFLMNHTIIVKNINNFWFLMRIYPNHIQTFDYSDLISEAYIVLDKCVENFQRKNKLMTGRDGEYDVTKKEYDYNMNISFYMYFNKSLTRSFYRLTEKYFKKHKNLRYSEDVFKDYKD
jgi:hypothetical protein